MPMRTASTVVALSAALMSTAVSAVEIQVTNAWVRSALSGTATTDVYMDVRSTTEVRLTGASTPWADSVEIRAPGDDGAAAKTPPKIHVVPVPANQEVKLDAGGYHLALLGVVRDIAGGEWVPITLDFQDAGSVEHQIDIRAQARGNMFPPGPPPPPLPR
jgi:copper(I)-binding protein